MKKKNALVLALALVSFSLCTARAEEPAGPAASPTASAANDRNHDESWYWGFNLGGGTRKYTDSATRAGFDALGNTPGMDHVTADLDLYFLWPLEGHHTAMGVALEGSSDSYKVKDVDTESSMTTSLLAFSAQHFFNSNIGDGLFGKADIGLATGKLSQKTAGAEAPDRTFRGWGFRLGAGYSILLSNETRLPITIELEHAKLRSDMGSNSVLFVAGLMF